MIAQPKTILTPEYANGSRSALNGSITGVVTYKRELTELEARYVSAFTSNVTGAPD